MSYGLKPNKCVCFPQTFGYCFKSLACRSKGADEKTFKKVTEEKRDPRRKKRPEIRAWRWDGSHEFGPVPEGRIPPGYEEY